MKKRILIIGILAIGVAWYNIRGIGNVVEEADFQNINSISVEQTYRPSALAILGKAMIERGYDRDEIIESIKILIDDKHAPETISGLLIAAAGLGKIQNQDLVQATKRVSYGFKNSSNILNLDAELNFLTPTESNKYLQLVRDNDYKSAWRIAFSAFERQVAKAS